MKQFSDSATKSFHQTAEDFKGLFGLNICWIKNEILGSSF